MRPVRWFLAVALVGVTVVTWLAGSCAIDDDIAWAGGSQCTGTCTSPPPSSYECDVDSSCTEAPGCEDWDCTEGPVPDGGEDDGGPLSSDGDEEAPDAGEGRDVPDYADDCVPAGASVVRETAQPVTLGVTRPGLSACLNVSGWLQFDVTEGARYELELAAPGDAVLGFQLYAGTDPATLAMATIAGTGTYGLEASANTTLFVRVRAMTLQPTPYELTVRELPER